MDTIDKGPNSLDVLRLLAALQSAAPRDNGEVILLAGNHEAEFLARPNAKKGGGSSQGRRSADWAEFFRKRASEKMKLVFGFAQIRPRRAHLVRGVARRLAYGAGASDSGTGEMFQRYGLLFLIDMRMSQGVGDSHGTALRITKKNAVAVCPRWP